MTYFLLLLLMVFSTMLYIKMATRFNIVDVPNERSSHSEVTIRGLGIVFILSSIFYFIYSDFQYPFFMLGLILAGTISFIDDIYTISSKTRILVQIVSVCLLLFELGVFDEHFLWVGFLLILGVGIINGFNFMDGINGLTGSYGLITVLTLVYINTYLIEFVDNDFLVFVGASLLIFLSYNFRKRAKGFSGDVGSIGIGLLIIFFVFRLVIVSNNYKYIFLIFIYGLDTISTILIRLYDKENIFLAHRRHFYQLLTNEVGLGHLKVALLYAVVQALLNCWIIYYPILDVFFLIPYLTVFVLILYCRLRLEKTFQVSVK
ncbi:UDP-GlcNAc--UDP-phosphate GlcNAc-1-phosphate transferase [uncultured Arcticibacterium sp.]|uniref:UDP-GlcNAc--UDP-phosphate GlcNAc-1-phosphate transferase n=1 Tax=uncultured Arcticibacterium sp. TaxID=2173042 RepID=UPI0030F56906